MTNHFPHHFSFATLAAALLLPLAVGAQDYEAPGIEHNMPVFAPALKAKIDNPATVLCPTDATPERFAEAILAAQVRKAEAIGVDLAKLWSEAALAHISFYDGLKVPA